jgi:hypothetical protein
VAQLEKYSDRVNNMAEAYLEIYHYPTRVQDMAEAHFFKVSGQSTEYFIEREDILPESRKWQSPVSKYF